jgi:hypothetical protein
LGLITKRPGRGFRSLFSAGDDVHNHLEVTNRPIAGPPQQEQPQLRSHTVTK